MSKQPPKDIEHPRSVRSFVKRTGRMSPAQKRALDKLWDKYGLHIENLSAPYDFTEVFGRDAPLRFEIGFGMGHSVLAMAKQHPEYNYIAVDVHEPGVARVINECEMHDIGNIRVFNVDAIDVLNQAIATEVLETVYIFFPDPWHKKRHHKRRLIKAEFVQLVMSRLQVGGRIHLATDWEEYAMQMMEVMSQQTNLINIAGHGKFLAVNPERMASKFEQRGKRLGHQVWDLIFVKEQ